MRYKIGDHVCSQSGLVYIVIAAHELDYCGSVAYSVRRYKGGKICGSTRLIAESALTPSQWDELPIPSHVQGVIDRLHDEGYLITVRVDRNNSNRYRLGDREMTARQLVAYYEKWFGPNSNLAS